MEAATGGSTAVGRAKSHLLFAKLWHKYPQHRDELVERSGIIADGCEISYIESDRRAAEMIKEKYKL